MDEERNGWFLVESERWRSLTGVLQPGGMAADCVHVRQQQGLFGPCAHTSLKPLMVSRLVPVMFWAGWITCCRAFPSWFERLPSQFGMFVVGMFSFRNFSLSFTLKLTFIRGVFSLFQCFWKVTLRCMFTVEEGKWRRRLSSCCSDVADRRLCWDTCRLLARTHIVSLCKLKASYCQRGLIL